MGGVKGLSSSDFLHVVNVVDIGVVMGDVDAGLALDALKEACEQALEVAIPVWIGTRGRARSHFF